MVKAANADSCLHIRGFGFVLIPTAEAKRVILRRFAAGDTVVTACRHADRSERTFRSWLAEDPKFRAGYEKVREGQAEGEQVRAGDRTISFEDFCPKYLHHRLYTHQKHWIEVLEGRHPTDLHPSCVYEPASPSRLLINTPPEHAKSTTITMDYVTYRLCMDPNVRIIVVSKTRDAAAKFLYSIKYRLTHPMYAELQRDFGPDKGFKADSDAWSAHQIYLGSDSRESSEKDPTVMAIGMGNQIYGARADLIILDDCVVTANAHEYEKQINWITKEVITRLNKRGKLLVVGTRMAPMDLYGELLNPERYSDGRPTWTYFAQPAVLEFAEDPKDWVTLWPFTDMPEDPDETPNDEGLFRKWDGPALYQRRAEVGPHTWALVYMQQAVSEDAVFPASQVKAAINGQRTTGPLKAGVPGHPPTGDSGMTIIAGLDPAMTGCTAAVVLAVDRHTKKRIVLDVYNRANTTPDGIRKLIFEWTEKYKISEWRIEKNAFQIMLTQDTAIRNFLANRGCKLHEHFTGGVGKGNKWDTNFGVASMATLLPLMGADGKPIGGLIDLPSTKQNEGVKALVEQLITWAPDTKNKTDCVMALWFVEIRARELCEQIKYAQSYVRNEFAPRGMVQQRRVINLNDAAQMIEEAKRLPVLT